jgi:prepilin-type N-terminal cleavage/methylation domain-containing protein
MKTQSQKRGFTIIEMLVSLTIFGLVISGVMTGWLFVIYGERQSSLQDKLDLDVRMSLENIRRDLRLSSMSKMYFYPAGVGPYTAISFPIAKDNDGDGLVELNSSTQIIWDITKIYHQYGTTKQFRITTFSSRDNTLTDAQRQAQIDAVASAGTGGSTYESGSASTKTLFENLFTWSISTDGAIFDGYNSSITLDSAATLGSLILTPGSHSYRFNVVSKNPSSSGYKLGLDALNASPSGGRREVEKQTIATSSGATPVSELMTNGTWSGNAHLSFPATATGHYFTINMENDRWEDENFGGVGASPNNTIVEFDSALSPKEFDVHLEGYGYTWKAADQTKDFGYDGLLGQYAHHDMDIVGAAVRVLVRGAGMDAGGYVNYDGQTHYVMFEAGLDNFRIKSAFIAEAASSNTITPHAAAVGTPLFFSGTSTNVDLNGGFWSTYAWPVGTTVNIKKEKSYQISYYVDPTPGQANAAWWFQTNESSAVGSYIVQLTNNPTTDTAKNAAWPDLNVPSQKLYGVVGIYSYYPTNGTYQSAIYDTHQTAPAYLDIAWTADLPGGSSIKMKVRSANSEDMSDANSWTSITAMTSGGAITPGAKRYIQYNAELLPVSGGSSTPRLKNVTVRFTGEQKVVDIGGGFSKGPNYGIFEMLVDSNKLQKGVSVAMQVYDYMPVSGGGTKRISSQASVEVEPRNTGR